MEIVKTALEGVLIIRPQVFHDSRGFFLETYQKGKYKDMINHDFVQDNLSYSYKGSLLKTPILSSKDEQYPILRNIPDKDIPRYGH